MILFLVVIPVPCRLKESPSSLEQAVAAPFATRQLADLGARVIKIERPDAGDSHAATTAPCSVSRVTSSGESIEGVADARHEGAPTAAVMAKLLEKADVFIENLAPAPPIGSGFRPLRWQERYPRLVVCSVSGYGSSGPYASKKGRDALVQSELGLISLTGTEEHPSKVGISVADISAGMHAYAGILTAPRLRTSTGRGTVVRVSLLDALAEWMSAPFYYSAAASRRSGVARHASIAGMGPTTPAKAAPSTWRFRTRGSGRAFARPCSNSRHWPRMMVRTNPDRGAPRELDETIADVFSRLTAEQVLARLDTADIASARLGSIGELASHPQFTARDRWREVESSGGPLALLPPVVMDGVTPAMTAIPALGQHTDAILGELGFDVATIAAWRAARTI